MVCGPADCYPHGRAVLVYSDADYFYFFYSIDFMVLPFKDYFSLRFASADAELGVY